MRILLLPAVAVLAAFVGCRAPARGSLPARRDLPAAQPNVPAAPSNPADASSRGVPGFSSAPKAESGRIVDHRGPRAVAFDEMVDRLATTSVVHLGEEHDQSHHHAFQARVFRALADRWNGKPVALGLEMFSRPYQPALDAYVRGEIDEAEMLKRSEWATRWGFGWEMYAPMLRLARERKIPILALNAEREITRTVSRKGLDALTPEQRASLPPLDVTVAAHRAFVKDAFGTHGASMPAERFERFYLAMVIWDEVMSSSVASWLAANGPDARMVVIAGNGHVADRYGIPARADKKSGRSSLVLVQRVVEPETAPAAAPSLSPDHADYTAWWAPSGPPPKPAKVAEPAKTAVPR